MNMTVAYYGASVPTAYCGCYPYGPEGARHHLCPGCFEAYLREFMRRDPSNGSKIRG